MDYICLRKCYFRHRIWKAGDVLPSREVGDVDLLPRHFVPKDSDVARETDFSTLKEERPLSYSQLQAKEAKEALKNKAQNVNSLVE